MPGANEIFDGEENWHARYLEQAPSGTRKGIHSDGIETFTVELSGAVDWAAFVDWLELLLASRGRSILRVKGLLALEDEPRPVVIHGVQHVVYPPEFLPGWPDGKTRPWLVFIARDLTRSAVENSLKSVLDAVK